MPPNQLPWNPSTGDTLSANYFHSLVDGTTPDLVGRGSFRTGPDIRLIQVGNLGPALTAVPTIASDTGITDPSGVFGALPALAVAHTQSETSYWQTVGWAFRGYGYCGWTMTKVAPAGSLMRVWGFTDLRSETCASYYLGAGWVTEMGTWPKTGCVICHETCMTSPTAGGGSSDYGAIRTFTYSGLVMGRVLGETTPGMPLAAQGANNFLVPYAGSATSLTDGIFMGIALGSCASLATGELIPVWFFDPVYKAIDSSEAP